MAELHGQRSAEGEATCHAREQTYNFGVRAGRSSTEKKKAGVSGDSPVVSQICTLWPLRFHQEFFVFSVMRPECPDIPSFAGFDDFFFKSYATHMSRWLPSNHPRLPANRRRLPANRRWLPSTKRKSCPLKNDLSQRTTSPRCALLDIGITPTAPLPLPNDPCASLITYPQKSRQVEVQLGPALRFGTCAEVWGRTAAVSSRSAGQGTRCLRTAGNRSPARTARSCLNMAAKPRIATGRPQAALHWRPGSWPTAHEQPNRPKVPGGGANGLRNGGVWGAEGGGAQPPRGATPWSNTPARSTTAQQQTTTRHNTRRTPPQHHKHTTAGRQQYDSSTKVIGSEPCIGSEAVARGRYRLRKLQGELRKILLEIAANYGENYTVLP